MVNPKDISKTCSKCGYLNKDLKGAGAFKCPRCGLMIDRQNNASRNIWNTFLKMRGHGFASKRAKPNEMLPMNPKGDEGSEAQGLSMGPIHIHA